ncbi:NAD(P)/FAD-dependent oxidoreductase [Rhodococcus sp. ARC_M6]|uniref:flavin-containing monooxygenase n=1 Tax=Rhodococcus sp. ARC_M6 TaxID=2928852 RepID=UPI001FB4FFF9|nr:NAD(P)/FAD-dependent oxidoreductase [Rhodococcus sp. ARC_M6]MCJ0904975.1 NAD(P)/FAD-dependent oxidoreductase [Rhodococcus sp. ARC_M6]
MVEIDTTAKQATPRDESRTRRTRVVVIGAGFGGIGTAVRLTQAGIDDFVILERAQEPGGTWQVNTYPGAQCDIPSILYSFSFAPNPHWTRLYPLQPEIYDYLRDCVRKFDLEDRLHCGQEVTDASWDEDRQLWRVHTQDCIWEAQFLVGATGPFSAPAVPNLPGLDSFEGQVFHTADWNHDHNLNGERIAVVGTGASAVQIIPRLQPIAQTLTVFQRTPTWILPHPDQPMTGWPSTLFERVPAAQRIARKSLDLLQEAMVPGFVYKPALLKGLGALGRAHLRRQVRDPNLRAKLLPQFTFGCKRPTFSNAYYPALASSNVDVVTDGIAGVRSNGIVTDDGELHEVDTIIMGTGFKMGDNPSFGIIKGRNGRSIAETWNGSGEAFLGTTINGFPNFFMILGPNSVVYTSQVVTIEAQVEYISSCVQQMDEQGIRTIEVRADVQQEFVDETDRRLATSVWNTGGCSSYYLVDGGRNFTFYGGFNRSFRARTRRADLTHYERRWPVVELSIRVEDGASGARGNVDGASGATGNFRESVRSQ